MIRLFTIMAAIARHRLDNLIALQRLPWPYRIIVRLLPWRYVINSTAPRAVRLRCTLEVLGPLFIKFGQVLSTRRDLLPDDISDELARLQDNVPPFPVAQAIAIIESSLGDRVATLFARFDQQPLASASVAQVHSAQLHSGEEVVIKVIRPGIEKVIRSDIRLMYLCARLLLKLSSDARRLRPLEVIADYEKTLFDELDLLREAANASQLRRHFLKSQLLYVPRVHWDYCRPRVMTMERVYGVPIADVATLQAQGTDMKKLAERGVEVFFTQVFRDRFFHADMHPGNILVDIDDPAEPRYVGVDFGIMGSLEPQDQRYLASNLLAFFRRDYRKVAQLHIDSGWVPRTTKIGELEAAIRTVCEPIFEKPLKDISFGQLLIRLFQTARRFNMTVQPQLVLLEKTLLNVEGLGRQLYPDLDLWHTAQPFLEQWMKQQVCPSTVVRSLRKNSADWLLNAPAIAQQALTNLRLVNEQQAQLTALHIAATHRTNRARWLGVGCMALAVVLLAFPTLVPTLPLPSLMLGSIGAWFLVR